MTVNPRALLFDWDNTLVDSWPCIAKASNITLEAMGHAPWTMDDVKARVAGSLRDTFPKIYGDRWEEARDIYYRAFEAVHLEMLAELDGAGTFVRAAHRAGIYLAVVSNKTGRYVRTEAEHLGWSPLFSRLVGAQDAARDKPAIDPVLLALEPTGRPPAQDVWFIGDNAIDVTCARNAGCTAVLIHNGANGDCDFAATDFPALAGRIGLALT